MNVFTLFGLLGSIFYSFMLFPIVIQAYLYGKSDANMGHLILQLLANICFVVYSIGMFKKTNLQETIPMFVANPISLISIIYLIKIRYYNIYDRNNNNVEVRVGSHVCEI